jgi:hypothetical protein
MTPNKIIKISLLTITIQHKYTIMACMVSIEFYGSITDAEILNHLEL